MTMAPLPDWLLQDNPVSSPSAPLANIPSPQISVQKKGGMFGGDFGWKQALAAGLAGFVSRQNPAILQGLMQAMMAKQRQKLEEAQYERERKDKREDFVFETGVRAQTKPDDQFTQMLRASGIDPNSEEGKRLYRQRVETMASPPYIFTDPTTGRVMSIPRTQSTLPQTLTDDDWGDAGGNASGGFQY